MRGAEIIKNISRRDHKIKEIFHVPLNCPILDNERVLKPEFCFVELARSIISQQLSKPAATAIWSKVTNQFGKGEIFAQSLLKADVSDAKRLGISAQKFFYIQNLAKEYTDGQISFENLEQLDDVAVINELVRFPGVGEWTAQMFLIFCLRRQDVFAFSDVGLIRALEALYKIERDQRPEMERISTRWRPYRSVVSWYLWSAIDRRIISG